MKIDGKIKKWKPDNDFGFIRPEGGGELIFVHLSDISNTCGHPKIGERVRFEMGIGPKGKEQAFKVVLTSRPLHPVWRLRPEDLVQRATASLALVPIFFVLLWTGNLLGYLPRWVIWFYLLASIATFIAYARDKIAAERRTSRTSEKTLHLLGIIGGWPGAFAAQELLRHKVLKPEFKVTFWWTVAINLFALIALLTS